MNAAHPAFQAFAVGLCAVVKPLEPSTEVMARMAAACDVQMLEKGDHLLRLGDIAAHIYFVHRGLLRYYFLDAASGAECTGQFFDKGQVVTDVDSFLTGRPARASFAAIEPSEVLRLPRAAITDGYDRDHAIERYGRLMVQQALTGSQLRAERLLTLSPEELYRTFVTTRPEVARRVPQYLIASYLGITPEALSRIRGRAARPPRD